MPSQPVILHKSAPGALRARRPFTRRRGDVSQQIRFAVQILFAAIALWVGVQFVMWVRYFESGGATLRVERPDGVEAWLPASLMNLKAFVLTGQVPELHAAGMFMLIAFLAISWLFRKAFCSWICPIGTLSEWLWQTGQSVSGRSLRVPRWLDVPLRGLKYVLLGLFLYVVLVMPVPEIRAFLSGPYADHRDRGGGARGAVARREEHVVPLSLSVRRADGARGARESDADRAERGRVH
jgi:hypothetical protein